ncbi:Putative pseudouridine synthase [Galdieria sulphuraria]|uniref:tRNA pseudouridine synthase D n=1 Tax=Galdieria sulphuraria TaxID=130081 RepID=M2XQ28_GALSU|nr:tRNA pseudouridine synthase D [Galdieria sulphuraria]EME32327.1 tRNA pseudouridine synthase D [Galdieria sulphuraria]GJD07172.1 Putative pseudouridine synthase [Galdieria sulphuraria]|eukprot:XP_005708847.1 tRNA pseudouridine synthase D [Galdieria sulphuraria]
MNSVTEESVFIRRFVSEHNGFTAIVRHLYSDFIVNEVSVDGNVLQLEKEDLQKPDALEREKQVENETCTQSALEQLEKWYEPSLMNKVRDFVATEESNSLENEQDSLKELILPKPILDKEERRQIHQLFRSFKGIVTETVSTDGSPKILLERSSAVTPNKRRRRISDSNLEENKFLSFLLCKKNTETSYVVSKLASLLHIRTGRFSFAGTKDKRGITTQEMRVRGVTMERLWQVGHSYLGKSSHIRIGRFKYCKEPLHLGELKGNRFTVILRNVLDCEDTDSRQLENIKEAIERVKMNGFINYFGLQRFGSGAIPSHHVGFEILRGNFEQVNRLILTPYDPEWRAIHASEILGESISVKSHHGKKDRPQIMEYLHQFCQGQLNAGQVYSHLPRFMTIERQLLNTYMKNGPNDHKGAFSSLPKGLKKMYVHAVQSYIWNAMASARMDSQYDRQFAMAGDLVLDQTVQDSLRTENNRSVSTEGDMESIADYEDLDVVESSEILDKNIKIVSEEEALEKKYPITQVYLPLVGTQMKWPQNECGQIAMSLLEEHSIDFQSLPTISQEFQFRGGYRKLISIPKQVEYHFMDYDEPNQSLTDIEEKLFSTQVPLDRKQTQDSNSCKRKMTALVLQFTLASSEYATMFLREVTKQDSSTAQQLVLEHQKKI